MSVAMVATGAQAGETVVTPLAEANADAHAIVDHAQTNSSSVGSSATDTTTSVDTTNASTSDDPTDATSVTVDGNAINPEATANNSTSTIDLSVLPNTADTGTGDGAASLTLQVNTAPVSATAEDTDADGTGNEIGARLQDFSTGSATVTGNTIEAQATGNKAGTLLHGDVLPAYASDAAGQSQLSFETLDNWLDATGSLVASTVQIQSDSMGGISNTALASDNQIGLNILNSTDDAAVSASATLDDNAIAATVAGNSSTSAIDLQSGGAPALIGTAVVTSGQINASPNASSSINATNQDSKIIATVAADDVNTGDDAEFQSDLSVSGNQITSSASGNQTVGAAAGQTGNSIVLADGMSFEGSSSTATPGTAIAYNAGSLTSTADGDLVIHNSQGNVGAGNLARLAVTGSTDDGAIAAQVDDISGGSVAVSGNQITGSARGNSASSALVSGDNMASFGGSATLANQQDNFYTNVLAEGTGDIYAQVADDDDLPKSTVTVDGNTVAANAYGNSVSQNLSLDAATQNLPLAGAALTAGTGPDGNVAAQGSLTVTNLQAGYNNDVDAREVHNVYADVSGEGDTVDQSTVAVTGNVGEAVSVGSSAANTLALSGTSVGGGSGIASLQLSDDDDGDDLDNTDITASSTGVVQLNSNEVASSTLEVSGNLQRAIAYGGSAANTLSVQAETMTVGGDAGDTASIVNYNEDANDGLVLTYEDQPVVDTAHGVLNVQSLNGDVAAQALPAYWTEAPSSFAVTVDGDVTQGSVVNDGNALVAAAYGADATNGAKLTVGNLDTSSDDFASVMNLTNVQEVSGSSSISAQATGEAVAYTEVSEDNDIVSSSVSTSSNTVQALAFANRAANSVIATGTNIDTAAGSFPDGLKGEASVTDAGAITDASFGLNNVQAAGGEITATLLDNPEDADSSAAIRTVIGDDVTDSSVVSNGNTLSSGATGNRADNRLDFSGDGLAATSAITNFQTVSEDTEVTSAIGVKGGVQTVLVDPGTLDTPPIPFDIVITGTALGHADGAFTSGTLFVDVTGFNGAQLAALESAGWSDAGDGVYSRDATGFAATGPEYVALDDGDSIIRSEETASIPGLPATYDDVYVPGSGGVTVAIGGDIDPSTVSVNNNVTTGSVTGNSASNALTVSGTGVAKGSDHPQTSATADGANTQANGDHMLANLQVVDSDDAALTSEVYGTFAIDTEKDVAIEGSTLTVDGNAQSSRAVANTAQNSVKLDATNTAAGAVLASNQAGGADVTAASEVDIFAPAASANSSVSMSDNGNLALGVINDATNTLTVETANAGPVNPSLVTPVDAIVDVDSNAEAFADHVLLNQQLASDTVASEAATSISNGDAADGATTGIAKGSVVVEGNTTVAEASANRAVNTADVSAGASLAAATGMTNSQVSSADVAASAVTSAGVALEGASLTPAAALNAGAVTVADNTTTALARGNAATNALNYAAGADYGAGSGNPAGSSLAGIVVGLDTDAHASAQAAVLNSQVNSGEVSASSTDATYMVALNTAGGSAVTNGTVGVIGNTVNAQAFGNTATNTLTLTALNTGMPTAAVSNYQVNSGPVTASVTAVTYGVTSGLGSVARSALSVSGNQVTASAVGNSATSVIAAGN